MRMGTMTPRALHPGGDGSTPGRAASGWGASMEAVGVPEERC